MFVLCSVYLNMKKFKARDLTSKSYLMKALIKKAVDKLIKFDDYILCHNTNSMNIY